MHTLPASLALAGLFALGLYAHDARAEQYDPPLNIGTLACPAGSTGYGNARFIVFPSFGSAPPNWRMTIWCSAGGSGRRGHFEPGGGGVFTAWPYAGGAFGIGWPASPNYGNQYQSLDIDSDGDLDVFQLVETAANTWSVYLSRTL
ncbi:hypothetical protein K4L06_05270 [Lysobacter sp. BMK333-48F3]|uniref:hypothetical protein n=1 Tax=Lysobacter sp. BMK333-48F3 TaxID=2867962 RepID=UPI001C8C71B3|nr:hypothetical protein [Lysobacter sp. BMK333-48F3]MBX9400714.1 hypothetical protein [Lysobacter sp. BMK333-48F3]